jgi:hypothetical protein
MTGGSSGNREKNALPDISVPFDRQVPENTANNSGIGPGVVLIYADENRHIAAAKPPVPEGGTPNDAAV